MDPIGKGFVLKHIFEDFAFTKESVDDCSELEEHFNIPWKISASYKNGYLKSLLYCGKSLGSGKWNIDVNLKMKIGTIELDLDGCFGNIDDNDFRVLGVAEAIEWKKMKEKYLVDGKFTVEMHVAIEKMTGIYKENLRCYDETMKEFSDIILVVGEKKLYVSKLFLATMSPFFNSMLLGKFKEGSKSKVSLTGIDCDDFQNYLEVLYGESAIDETTIEGPRNVKSFSLKNRKRR